MKFLRNEAQKADNINVLLLFYSAVNLLYTNTNVELSGVFAPVWRPFVAIVDITPPPS